MSLDLSRWAFIGLNDATGLGRMGEDVKRVLGLKRKFVAPSERMVARALAEGEEQFLPSLSIEELRRKLEGLQGLLFFERCSWHEKLLSTAAELKIATVCVPMWEWFQGNNPAWKLCTLFACPTNFTAKIVKGYGYENVRVIPWAQDLSTLPRRIVSGPARHFIHNAGLVDHDDRKGTRDTIQAFMNVPRHDIRLVVRLQKAVELPRTDSRVEVQIGNLDSHTDLYKDGDVAIQPSKMEGIGFMVLEPVCCGIPVITTNYPPMNEFVQQPEMLVKVKWLKRRAFPTQWIPHAHLRLPRVDDISAKIAWCAENPLDRISQQNREWAENTFNPQRLFQQWTDLLETALAGTR